MPLQRRTIAAAGLLAVAVLTACGAPTPSKPAADSGGDVPDKPSKAVTLNILDVAGNLQLTQPMIDDFLQQHHDVISKVTYSKAPAPELAGKIKAQQNANRVDIDLVLTGTDGMSAGQEQGLWLDLLQAKAYDKGYFYPGPAIKGVDLSKAPQESQDAITQYGRPEYDKLIADNPTEVPLDAKSLVAAFAKWDRDVGGAKVKQQ